METSRAVQLQPSGVTILDVDDLIQGPCRRNLIHILENRAHAAVRDWCEYLRWLDLRKPRYPCNCKHLKSPIATRSAPQHQV